MSGDSYIPEDVEMAVDSDDELVDDEENYNGATDMILAEATGQSNAPEPGEEDSAIARRKAIQAIMRDKTLSEVEKRVQCQNLMSGGRTEVTPPQAPVLPDQSAPSSCVHYERNCMVVAPCCNGIFGCRVCHDELSPSGHTPLDRFSIREVVCKKCNTRQPTS